MKIRNAEGPAITGSFDDAFKLVVNKFEGGYSRGPGHNGFSKNEEVKKAQLRSGETMFGIDRKNFAGAIDKLPPSAKVAWEKYWGIMDRANAKTTWPWNYRGGSYESELRSLAADIMFAQYTRLSKLYLTKEARELVAANFPLMVQVAYFTWNGSGFFSWMAPRINNNVSKGARYVWNQLQDYRLSYPNEVIKRSGRIMAKLGYYA